MTLPPKEQGCADKFLARPGRKKATANKIGIYSTCFPRSSVNFLARCSNFCKPLKKIQKIIRPTRSPRQQWLLCRTKNGDFSIVFPVQGPGGRLKGPDPENRVGDQDTGSPGRPVSFGFQVPGEPGHSRARTRPPWWSSRGVFPSKCHSIAPAEMNNTHVDSLALWKIINEEDAVLIPKYRGENFSSVFLHSEFLGWGEPLWHHSIDCCFVSGS